MLSCLLLSFERLSAVSPMSLDGCTIQKKSVLLAFFARYHVTSRRGVRAFTGPAGYDGYGMDESKNVLITGWKRITRGV